MTATTVSEYVLKLNFAEREQLMQILNDRLKGLRVKIHRTDALAFREALNRDEAILLGLIDKVQASGDRPAN